MDKKVYRSITSYGVDVHSNISRVGDGANSTKNGLNLVLPASLASAALSQKSKRSPALNTYGSKNTKFKHNSHNNNNNCNNNNINNNNNSHNINGATKTNASNSVMLAEPAAAAAANSTSQRKQAISPVNNMKTSTMATVRMKNEEAVNDLRQRIPEIERIFDVHTRIGNGTFSTVLLGTLKKERHLPEESRRKFAIKHHIPTSHPERIMRELQCMANIGGVDNVVGINCCMRCNESVAFIMPYMPHDRFHDFYSKMDLAEVQYYMKSLLQALRRVHRFNVIHRDVKPSNFLYNRSRRQFLLVDFGLAQQAPTSQSQIEAIAASQAATTALTATQQKSLPARNARITGGSGCVGGGGGGGGAGEGNKRAREQDDDDDIEGTLKSCLDTGSDTSVATANNGERNALVVSGVAKRLRCTGPHGDQQVAAASVHGGGGGKVTTTESAPATFKMPLKQLNEIQMPGGKALALTNIGGNNAMNSTTSQQNNAVGAVAAAAATAAASATTDASKYNTNRNLNAMHAAKCFCYGNAQVCNICLIKKEIHASRAGTPGYRPPEVLLKYADQTTAVDIWAAGVIFLSILSSVYPFFKAPNDFVALAEMVTIFGDKSIRNTACLLDRLVTLSQHSKPLDLRKLCVRFRNRAKFSSPEMLKRHQRADGTCEICKNCDQYYFNCLCAESTYTTESVDNDDSFPASAYDLLYRLLEVNPHKRITAEQALQHPFFAEINKNSTTNFINACSNTISSSTCATNTATNNNNNNLNNNNNNKSVVFVSNK